MKKQFAVLVTVVFFASTVTAQKASIKGSITDTLNKQNLTNSVISVLKAKDSVLVKFTRSNETGNFELKNLPAGKFVLMISYPAYADYVYPITLTDTSNEDVGVIK